MAGGIVFLGDDFTGASDSLATYARGGLAARMVLRGEGQGGDVLGLPTDLRSLSPDRARAEIARLWPVVARAEPQVLHFKVCSTFDSGPGIGSIGAVVQDLAQRFRPDVMAVIGGQPGLGRYCAFGTLFARGPDGEIHRIDRHPVMRQHPVTPMTEADLRCHLSLQGLEGLGLIPAPLLPDTEAVTAMLRAGPALIDVVQPGDLAEIARALRRIGGRQLLVGPSSVAELLAPPLKGIPRPVAPRPQSSRVLGFAGSRSSVSFEQVRAAHSYQRIALTPQMLTAGKVAIPAQGPVLLHLLPEADYGLSPDALADACAALLAGVLAQTPVGHLALAGGDTSSRICTRLGFSALEYDRAFGPGVCICRARHDAPDRDNMRVLLKGGQMGDPDLFDRFAQSALLPCG